MLSSNITRRGIAHCGRGASNSILIRLSSVFVYVIQDGQGAGILESKATYHSFCLQNTALGALLKLTSSSYGFRVSQNITCSPWEPLQDIDLDQLSKGYPSARLPRAQCERVPGLGERQDHSE